MNIAKRFFLYTYPHAKLSLRVADRISIRRFLDAVGQEVSIAYIVKYKIFVWAFLSFNALYLLHKMFGY